MLLEGFKEDFHHLIRFQPQYDRLTPINDRIANL